MFDFDKCRFYTKEQINNALQITDDVSGELIDVFNAELALKLEDFDGCANKSDIKIRFNQLCPSRMREI